MRSQGRIFSYKDTQRHRLGPNFQQLPVNRPIVPVTNYERDGQGTVRNQGGAPTYFPNSFNGPEECDCNIESTFAACGDVKR